MSLENIRRLVLADRTDAVLEEFGNIGLAALVDLLRSQISETVLDELGVVNVIDHGADPDGAEDATVAFVAAVAEAVSLGLREVYVPAGNYSFVGTTGDIIDLPDGIMLVGAGPSTVLTFTALEADAVSVAIRGRENAGVRNLRIVHDVETSDNQHAVLVDESNDCLVEGVQVDGADRGIWFTNAAETADRNARNVARSCIVTNSFGYGFYAANAVDGSIEGCIGSRARSQDGFKTGLGCERMRVANNLAYGNARDGFDFYDGFIHSTAVGNISYGNTLNGFEVKGNFGGTYTAGDYVVRNSTFNGNVAFNNGVHGFLIQQIRGCSLGGNQALFNAEQGFFLSNVQASAFDGCESRGNTQHGWYLTSSSRNTFVGCHANDNSWVDGTVQNGTYNGWEIVTDSNINSFVGCAATISTTVGRKGGQGYGMRFDTAAVVSNTVVGLLVNANVTGEIGGTDPYGTQNIVSWMGSVFHGPKVLSAAHRLGFTSDSGSNAEWIVQRTSGATARLQAQATLASVGTESTHPLHFLTNGTLQWQVDTNGHLKAVEANRNLRISGNLGVGNSAAATTPGTVTKKIEVFDNAGASLGFVAVYDAIT